MNKFNAQLSYKYYIKSDNSVVAQSKIHEEFDPASISKIFYLYYATRNLSIDEILSTTHQITIDELKAYGYGTRVLSRKDIGKYLNLETLLNLSIINSCNISTGILADIFGRDNVNNFLRVELELQNSTVFSNNTQNVSTSFELVRTLELLDESYLIDETNRDFAMNILSKVTRRAVIRSNYPDDYEINSKGGTTFSGLRRDLAIINKPDNKRVFIIVAQHNNSKDLLYNSIDRFLAGIGIGKLSRYLKFLDEEFRSEVQSLIKKYG